MCYRIDEDGGNLFFKCKYVKLVWREIMLEDKKMCLAEAMSQRKFSDRDLPLGRENTSTVSSHIIVEVVRFSERDKCG
jgi:hypothetical protein